VNNPNVEHLTSMTVIPPFAAVQAGHTSGGGFLSNLTGGLTGGAAAGGTTGPTQAVPGPKGDGSVGLFDGVLKKAFVGGAAGAVFGFILPGGPVLGGIMGALSGAAMGMFSNWSKMKSIKTENEATMAALGVQSQDPNIKQVLQSGNVQQLIPMMAAEQATQGSSTQTGTQSGAGSAKQAGPNIASVTDPATGITQMIDLTTGQVVQQGAAVTQQQQATAMAQGQMPAVVDPSANAQQSPLPTQGTVAVGSGAAGVALNPNVAVDPGVAPALQASKGGGGSAGTVGQPSTPVATAERSDASAIAPAQAGIGAAPAATMSKAQLANFIQRLQSQVDQLKQYLAEQQRIDDTDVAAAR